MDQTQKELNAKWLLKSKTIIGVLTVLAGLIAPLVAKLWEVDLGPWVEPVGLAIGLALVLYARLMDGGKLTLSFAKAAELIQLATQAGSEIADKTKTAVNATKGAFVLLLLPSLGLSVLLLAGPAWAAEQSGAAGLFQLSLMPLLINVVWVLAAFALVLLLWKFVIDRWIVLPGVNTFHLIRDGNVAAGVFAGCCILGLCILIGLVIG